MKKNIFSALTCMVMASAVFAQTRQNATEDKLNNFIDSAVSKAIEIIDALHAGSVSENLEFEPIVTPYEIKQPKKLSKKEIVDDMNYMWSRLVDVDDITVLVSDSLDDMDWDFQEIHYM